MTTAKTTTTKTRKPRKERTTPKRELGITSVEAYGYPILEFRKVPHTEIKRGYNVRTDVNVQKVTDILSSIRTLGVKDNIHILPNGEALDGYRRLHCCDILASENGNQPIEVPVIIVDVPLQDIPLYQVLCSQRKGLVKDEIHGAVSKFCFENPKASSRDIAGEFGVTHTTVTKLRTIINAGTLGELYINNVITQQAALKIIEAANNQPEADREQYIATIASTAEKYRVVDVNSGKTKQTKITGRHIGKAIKSISPGVDLKTLKGSLEDNKEDENHRSKRLNLKTLMKKILNVGVTHYKSEKDLYQITFNLSKEEYTSLKKALSIDANSSQDNIEYVTISANKKSDETTLNRYEIYLDHTYQSDAVVLVDDGNNGFISYQECAELVAEKLKLSTFVLDSVPAIRISKDKLKSLQALKLKVVTFNTEDILEIVDSEVETMSEEKESLSVAPAETSQKQEIVTIEETESKSVGNDSVEDENNQPVEITEQIKTDMVVEDEEVELTLSDLLGTHPVIEDMDAGELTEAAEDIAVDIFS